jgi:hypothetical protein
MTVLLLQANTKIAKSASFRTGISDKQVQINMKKYLIGSLSILFALHLGQAEAKQKGQTDFDYVAFTVSSTTYNDLFFAPGLTSTAIAPYKQEVASPKISYRAFYGYQFNPYIAVEAGLNVFGQNDYVLFNETTDNKGAVTKNTLAAGEFSSMGGDLRVVATYPVTNNFYFKATVGALAWDSDKHQLREEGSNYILTNTSETGVSPVASFGMSYGFRRVMAISLDVEQTEVFDVKVRNIGITATFRL